MNDLLPYLILAIVLIMLAAVAGRIVSRRSASKSSAGSQPIPAPQPGEDRCLLRADLNYTNDSPATSRVTITYYNGDQPRYEVLSNAMTQPDFNKLRAQLRSEGWREEGSSSDREGESYTLRRAKR
jgi:hypothetical protein